MARVGEGVSLMCALGAGGWCWALVLGLGLALVLALTLMLMLVLVRVGAGPDPARFELPADFFEVSAREAMQVLHSDVAR